MKKFFLHDEYQNGTFVHLHEMTKQILQRKKCCKKTICRHLKKRQKFLPESDKTRNIKTIQELVWKSKMRIGKYDKPNHWAIN